MIFITFILWMDLFKQSDFYFSFTASSYYQPSITSVAASLVGSICANFVISQGTRGAGHPIFALWHETRARSQHSDVLSTREVLVLRVLA